MSFASFWSIAPVAMIVVALGLVIVESMLALIVRNRPGSAVMLAFGGLAVAPFVALLLSTITRFLRGPRSGFRTGLQY